MNPLIDGYGRPVDYLRISVTDRCNLRCFYCMPRTGVTPIPHGDILSYEEIISVIESARALGFSRFRITGGEPLVRKGLLWFLAELAARGISYSITTNGVLLEQSARGLREAGLTRINVGLDTLRRGTFRRITGADWLEGVLRGIAAARREGIGRIKVNVVVMRGVNECELGEFMEWGRRERLDLRFIEFMPVYGDDLYVPLRPWIEAMSESGRFVPCAAAGDGPAKSFRDTIGGNTVGFIMPRTEPFCAGCNRIRLTADGTILPCLFSSDGIDIRSPLRRGEDISGLIAAAVRAKPEGHRLAMRLHRYSMHAVGG